MKILETLRSFFKKKKPLEKPNQPIKKTASPPQISGKIKYFNNHKGYGFIESRAVNDRIFVHISDLGQRARVGNMVQFDLKTNKRGYQAKNVKRLHQKQV